VRQVIDLVGLPERAANLFPHEFSGGSASASRSRDP